jgi:putative acyl-CoA dehydrogenase
MPTQVEYHPSYHNFMEVGIDHGATRPRPELEGRGAHVVRASHMYMQNQIEAGHCCPLVMTHAAIPLFKSNALPDTVAKPWLERLLNGTRGISNTTHHPLTPEPITLPRYQLHF